jgi:cytochrome bd-type quinol oxidase subunit 2
VLHPLVMRFFFLAFQRPEPLPRAAWDVLVMAVAVVASFLLGRVLGRIPGLFGLPPLPASLAPARASVRETV